METKCPPSDSNEILNNLLQEYIYTFSEKEHQAYEIAKEFLGMSFQLEKSNGFLQFKKSRQSCVPTQRPSKIN